MGYHRCTQLESKEKYESLPDSYVRSTTPTPFILLYFHSLCLQCELYFQISPTRITEHRQTSGACFVHITHDILLVHNLHLSCLNSINNKSDPLLSLYRSYHYESAGENE